MPKWFDVKDVARIQLELTNYCNAGCPMCDRYEFDQHKEITARGQVDLNSRSLSLADIKKAFGQYDWPALESVHYCGCLDEPTINSEMLEITEFFLSLNANVSVRIATNGGTRSEEFWRNLGSLSKSTNRVIAVFGIDGLRENNHFYRRNVNWDKLERNFRSYIGSGGHAMWKCIIFPYNLAMLKEIHDVSVQEGFKQFILMKTGRSSVYLGEEETQRLAFDDDVQIPDWYQRDTQKTATGLDMVELQATRMEAPRVHCIAKPNSSDDRFHPTGANIYVDYKGQVTPCCWTGNTFGLIELQEKAMKVRGIDKTAHSMLHHAIQEIIDGPFWDFLHDEFEITRMCVNKCKKYQGDVWL